MRDRPQERAPFNEKGAPPNENAPLSENGPVSAPRHCMPQRARDDTLRQTWRATIIFLTSAIALAGFRPFGQAFAQFMMVWQR